MDEKTTTFEPRADLGMATPPDCRPALQQVPRPADMSGQCRTTVTAGGDVHLKDKTIEQNPNRREESYDAKLV